MGLDRHTCLMSDGRQEFHPARLPLRLSFVVRWERTETNRELGWIGVLDVRGPVGDSEHVLRDAHAGGVEGSFEPSSFLVRQVGAPVRERSDEIRVMGGAVFLRA